MLDGDSPEVLGMGVALELESNRVLILLKLEHKIFINPLRPTDSHSKTAGNYRQSLFIYFMLVRDRSWL